MITIIRGQDKNIVVRLKSEVSPNDPYDFTDIEVIQTCFKDIEGNSFFKTYVPIVGDVTSTSDLISGITSTLDIKEGQPISGAGIPAGTTVLKTPESTVDPTADGTIQISAAATLSNSNVALLVGDLVILNPVQWGKFKIVLSEDDTDLLGGTDFEVKVRTAGVTLYTIFENELNIVDRIC